MSKKAIALFSGGLDSTLAMKLVIDQGVEVIAVNINTGFGGTKSRLAHMQNMCEQVGAKFEVLDVKEDYLQSVLFDAKHGYGKHFNPCIDCHGYMFRASKVLMEKYDADFMISGEVVGQRPMSQRVEAIETVTEISGMEGYIVRPMSAKLLPITIPEEKGWLDRDKLLDISGRSRKRQMELVKNFGITDFEPPAGGCLLTEESFSNKIREFIKFRPLEVDDIDVLKFGRHMRLPDGAKLVIGRHKDDNQALLNIQNDKFELIKLLNATGPVSLISENATQEDKELAVKLTITYGKTNFGEEYQAIINNKDEFTSTPFETKEEAKPYFISEV